MRVLLAEDHPQIRALALAYLHKMGHEVVDVIDGSIAWDLLKGVNGADGFDLIISDVVMPNMEGTELLERVRNHPKFRSVKFVLMSGNVNRFDVFDKLCRDSGAVFLEKPFTREKFEEAVKIA